jgi:hypothetical protein
MFLLRMNAMNGKPQSVSPAVAGAGQNKDLTIVDQSGDFATAIRLLFKQIKPTKLIETGTYRGTGTTTIIAEALRELKLHDSTFFSIEINPKNYSLALAHVEQRGYRARLLNGLSVPRDLLPTRADIDRDYVKSAVPGAQFVDHQPETRAELYFRETDFSFLPDDLLGFAMDELGNRPDFVLLDSGGHMGLIEFNYLIGRLRGPCWIALDDILHVKHARSYQQMQADPRFTIRTVSSEKFGFCIAHYTPRAAACRKETAA